MQAWRDGIVRMQGWTFRVGGLAKGTPQSDWPVFGRPPAVSRNCLGAIRYAILGTNWPAAARPPLEQVGHRRQVCTLEKG